MKIRNGFVSNSSSSSFIVRGMRLSTDEIIKTLNISKEDIEEFEEDEYELLGYLSGKFEDLQYEPDGNYFGELDYSTIVVGKSLTNIEDGEMTEMSNLTEEQEQKVIDQFKSLGFTGELSTYIRFVSNDNY